MSSSPSLESLPPSEPAGMLDTSLQEEVQAAFEVLAERHKGHSADLTSDAAPPKYEEAPTPAAKSQQSTDSKRVKHLILKTEYVEPIKSGLKTWEARKLKDGKDVEIGTHLSTRRAYVAELAEQMRHLQAQLERMSR